MWSVEKSRRNPIISTPDFLFFIARTTDRT